MVMRRDGLADMNRDIMGQRYADPIHRPIAPVVQEPAPNGAVANTALIAAINALAAKIDALGRVNGNGGSSLCIPPNGQMVQFETISLLEANTNTEITIAACATYCQAFCDGPMDGITIKVRDQSAEPIDLGKFHAFPLASNTNKVWLTSDGRLGRSRLVLAFGVGAPVQGFTTHPEITELAARLGGLSSYHRSGEVVFQDDFSAPNLGWIKLYDNLVTGGSMVSLSADNPLYGSQCVKLQTGATAANIAGIEKNLWVPPSPTMGLETSLRWAVGEDESWTDLYLALYSGVNVYVAQVLLRMSSTLTDTPGIIVGGTNVHTTWVPYNASSGTWHRVKFTVDMAKVVWGTLMFDASVISVRGIALSRGANATNPHIRIIIRHVIGTAGAANKVVSVGHVILTNNEPAADVGPSASTGGALYKTGAA